MAPSEGNGLKGVAEGAAKRAPVDDGGVLAINKGSGFVRVADPGDASVLDITNGESLTLEAQVRPAVGSMTNGQHMHIIGKGRTGNPGVAADNLNYGLRLTGEKGRAAISFLFRSAPDGDPAKGQYHRWTSTDTFPADGGWHHVAVTYHFMDPDSIRGFIDGEPVSGKWDMGGPTESAPVVDNDELWIGSGAGGGTGSTFRGELDEVAFQRSLASDEQVANWRTMVLTDRRFRPAPVMAIKPDYPLTPAPHGTVLVEFFEGIRADRSWMFRWPKATESYVQDSFGFVAVPKKYSDRAVQIDRSRAFGMRASSIVAIPAGEYEVLIRGRSATKLIIDGKSIAETPFHTISSSGHGVIRDWRVVKEPQLRRLQPGDHESLVEFATDGAPREVRFEMYVGAENRRPELGETGIFLRRKGEQEFRLLGYGIDVALNDADMLDFHAKQRRELTQLNLERRRELGRGENEYWDRRHGVAWDLWREKEPIELPAAGASGSEHPIDRLVEARIAEANASLPEFLDDWSFLRRVTLDVIGTVPTPEHVDRFFSGSDEGRRERYLDWLLEQPGWADHWVGYWQDVLAENPNIINPTLNNTGPFRWWLYDSFLENKPFDRLATELILMEGSTAYGGPGGFALATQNDAPMAAKAHVLGQALLAVDMSCARCHDSPTSDLKQEQLFALAAMLKRGPQDVPKTSSVPPNDDPNHVALVEVTLKPGTKVEPAWSFGELAPADELPKGLIRNPGDERERLAAIITSPRDERFVKVLVNRMWRRYLGRGIVEPVHDWNSAQATDPVLLDFLARAFVESGYDLKALAKLILTSQTYQRRPVADPSSEIAGLLPIRRRMSAEQVVDSMFLACGKRFKAGEINIDSEGARELGISMNLGRPERAWEFMSLSNERDRPALSLPKAQPFVTMMEAFGWRGSRQTPESTRDEDPGVLQPGLVANGVLARRFTRLSDDSAFTELALSASSASELIDETMLRVLNRPARPAERDLFASLIAEGFDTRLTGAEPLPFRDYTTTGVGWTNQHDPNATIAQEALQVEVEAGDPASPRLESGWRERYEDVLWTLLNSPEFVFLP